MSESDLTNFGTWWLDNKDKIFRFFFYKKDKSGYITDLCTYGIIEEAIELPDGDILLGLNCNSFYDGVDCFFDDSDEGHKFIEYCKLSEIDIQYSESDNTRDYKKYDDEDEDWSDE